MSRSEAAILCIGRNEQPFISEWLEYHFNLGFQRIYFISTDSDFSKVKKFFDASDYKSKISLHHFDEFYRGWQMNSYNKFFPLVKEDWVLVMDIDEYLYLNSYSDVQSFLDTIVNDVGQIQFPWLNLISTSYVHERISDILECSQKHASDHVKSMVRRDSVTGLGIHSHGIRGAATALSSGAEIQKKNNHEIFLQNTQYYKQNPFILHFCSRGYFDVINRIVDHQFFNIKGGVNERRRLAQFLTNEHGWKNIPTRFLLMQILQLLPIVDLDISWPDLGSHTDIRNLQEIFLRHIKDIIDFNWHDNSEIDDAFETQYGLKYKLSQMDLSAKFDQSEYLGCASQLEYVARLRKRLV